MKLLTGRSTAYRTSIDIAAPVERVWEILVDIARWPEWSQTMTKVERLDEGELRPGSRARVRQPRLPKAIWRVTELTPGKGFTWATSSAGVTTVAGHLVTPLEGGGTRAESDLTQTGPLARIAALFLGRLTRQYLEQESQGLKKRCEQTRDGS